MWNELSVSNMWPEAIKLATFIDYMPEDWIAKQSKVERNYFWTILVFLAEGYVQELIKDCRKQRAAA